MFLKHLSGRERNIFYFAVIIILCVILYAFAVEPLLKKWRDLNESVSSKEMQLLKNKKILSQKDVITQLYDKYAENIRMKGTVEEETAIILREIENIARTSNTYITDIKPLKVEDKEFYKVYSVELETEGNMPDLSKFIYDLQNSKQILKVRYLRLNPKNEAEDVLKGYMIVTKILIP